ncbi:MAG: hypothetical protein M1816_005973 [Peltula sp. TS41687]|nr:MAG: hypothetical protein M1816_005973 [Peltula sp. TS41687]
MATPPVRLSRPSVSLHEFLPDSVPTTVPPPTSEFTYAPRFNIPVKLYNHLLEPYYPFGFALLYVVAVYLLNRKNCQRGNKPWSFAKSGVFFGAVILHNLFLTVFSGWVLRGMAQAVRHSWPGWPGEHGLAGTVDALCKIHGPRGLGNGVAYNATTNIWTAPNVAVNLTPLGLPDNTDLGRIWNEGLGFYGWLFYISKFYEVLDTFILLAKGKTPSTLQVFHHAGALISLWAGIRYMSPPIWMWVLVNAGVHTMMYSYYALKSMSVPIPWGIKPIITTLQILQFIVGATFAAAHLFIQYSVPVSIPYTVTPSISSVVSAASSVASTAASSVATAASSAGIGQLLRKVALRAAGEEGLAQNVPLKNKDALTMKSETPFEKVREMAHDLVKSEVRYRTEEQMIPCLDTSGQAFAILLNLLYLAPLTILFINFWRRSYTKRTSAETAHPTTSSILQKTTRDAVKGVKREFNEEPLPLPEQTEEVGKIAREKAEEVGQMARETTEKVGKVAQETTEKVGKMTRETVEKAGKATRETVEKAGKATRETAEKARNVTRETAEKAGKAAQDAAEGFVSGLEKEAMNDEHLGDETASAKEDNDTKRASKEQVVNRAGKKSGPQRDQDDLVNGNTNKDKSNKEERDVAQEDTLNPKNFTNASTDEVSGGDRKDQENTAPEAESRDDGPSYPTRDNNRNQQKDNKKEAERQAAQNPNRSLILSEAEEDKQMIVVDPKHSTINRTD